MIERLKIANYAIIDVLEIEFIDGLSVFTGETGAGKSIVLGAIGLLLGERSDSSAIRTGAEKTVIEGAFAIRNATAVAALKNLNIDEPENLIIRREISMDGKNRIFVNGNQETIARLTEIGEFLIDMHGQHDHQLLLNSKMHIDILDGFGGLQSERNTVGESARQLIELFEAKKQLEQDEEKLAGEKQFWEAAITNIGAAKLGTNEESELSEALMRMENAEKISGALDSAYLKLYSDELAAAGRVSKSIDDLRSIEAYDSRYRELIEMLSDAEAKIKESVNLISDYRDKLAYDASTMDSITDRLTLIRDLKRKYKCNSIQELNDYAESCSAKLSRFSNRAEELSRLEESIRGQKEIAVKQSLALSTHRQETARKLSTQIKAELAYLGMEKAEFVVSITYVKDEASAITINQIPIRLTESGIDRVEFFISANVGEEPKPLKKVASGGEISRVMLAIKSILADKDMVETLVFDEIDVGIGGVTANNVGEKMKSIAQKKQLLVITHLAQIASKSNRHYFVEKTARDGKTFTGVRELTEAQRIDEIARMLGGESDAAKAHAREMLGR